MESTLSKSLTYADYTKMTPPDSGGVQLIQGELVTMTSPNTQHQRIIRLLAKHLDQYLDKNPIGEIFIAPIDVLFQDGDVYQPDVLFILNENKQIIEETKINGTPDFVVEVLSPSNAYYDLVVKKKVYEKCGVKEYWIVDPIQKTLDLFILVNKKFQLKPQVELQDRIPSNLFPSLDLVLESIF